MAGNNAVLVALADYAVRRAKALGEPETDEDFQTIHGEDGDEDSLRRAVQEHLQEAHR